METTTEMIDRKLVQDRRTFHLLCHTFLREESLQEQKPNQRPRQLHLPQSFHIKIELVIYIYCWRWCQSYHFTGEKSTNSWKFYLCTKSNRFLLCLNWCIIVNCSKVFFVIFFFLLERWPEKHTECHSHE